MSLRELIEKRAVVYEEMKGIHEEHRGEDLPKEKEERWEKLNEEYDGLTKQIKAAEEAQGGRGGSSGLGSAPGSEEIRLYNKDSLAELRDRVKRSNTTPGIDPEELSGGRAIRAMITGDWSNAEAEKRAMGGSNDVAGGYLLPEPLSADILMRAFDEAVLTRAGINYTPMDHSTLLLPVVNKLPAAQWVPENAEIPTDNPELGLIRLTSKKLSCIVKCSLELAEDGVGVEDVITSTLGLALANSLDKAALIGTGAGEEPFGICPEGTPAEDVQEIEHNGAITGYSPFSQANTKLMEQNGNPNALIINPRDMGRLDLVVDGEGQPQTPPQSWGNYRKFTTNQLPTNLNGDKSIAILGDFRKLVWAIRHQLRINISHDSGFDKHQVWIKATLRGDIAMSHRKHFCAITGIEPGAGTE